MKKAIDIMRIARAFLLARRPYLGRAIYAHIFIEADRCPTMSVDRYKRLYYNPAFVETLGPQPAGTVVLHEVGHSLGDHHERAEMIGVSKQTASAANRCMDAALNAAIRREIDELNDMHHLPAMAVYPESLGFGEDEMNKPWEYYFHRLPPELRNKPLGYDCGSGAHGQERPWEHGDPASSGVEGVYPVDWDDIKRNVAQDIANHQRVHGNVPGHWVSWADHYLEPAYVPWDQLLMSELRWALADIAGMILHSYERPSRRQAAYGNVLMPARRQPVPRVAVVGDTSMSMNEKHDLALVRGVVTDICRAVGADVTFLATDTQVHTQQSAFDGMEVELAGRGGTNMAEGIRHASEEIVPPVDIIVVVTDGETPWPAKAPPQKVIVCLVSDGSKPPPSWATTILVDPQEAA